MPGINNTFFHVLLTPWPRMFTGSGALVRIPCYEIFFFFSLPSQKGIGKKKWGIWTTVTFNGETLYHVGFSLLWTMDTDAQLENCELSFIWSKLNTGAQETAPQITLRDCSKRRWGKVGVWDSVQSSANLTKSISASHEEPMSPFSDIVLFWIWRSFSDDSDAKCGTPGFDP